MQSLKRAIAKTKSQPLGLQHAQRMLVRLISGKRNMEAALLLVELVIAFVHICDGPRL